MLHKMTKDNWNLSDYLLSSSMYIEYPGQKNLSEDCVFSFAFKTHVTISHRLGQSNWEQYSSVYIYI